jgi:aryl-alcohol dehydrogenase-like predicted oxidoreductase
MKQRRLGLNGPLVSAIGLGGAAMGDIYGATDQAEALATIRRALDLGVTFIDTSDAYGPFTNEELIGRAIAGRRDEVVLSTKVGIVLDPTGPGRIGVNGRPEHVRSAIDASLRRLQVDSIEVYYLHRVDPRVPVEETVGAMAEQVAAGKVRWLGLSETTAETLLRAHRVHPIVAMESEYSLMVRDPEGQVLDTCRRLGVGLVAYSPLGRGLLTATLSSDEPFDASDIRPNLPRFQGDNLKRNLSLTEQLKLMAERKGCLVSQLALAWVLSRGSDIVPIPGTKRRKHLETNIAAVDLVLSEEDQDELEDIFRPGAVSGARYSEAVTKVWSS